MKLLPKLLILAFVVNGWAGTIYNEIGAQMDILVGTSTLTAPGGPFSATFMTVGWGSLLRDPSDLSVIVPSFASRIAADTTLPKFVRDNIGNFVGSNLGFSTDQNLFSDILDPALYTLLTTQPVPFAITSDSGYAYYGAPFAFQYLADSAPQNCPQNSPGNTIICDYILNVSTYTRSMNEIATTPEPASLVETGFGAILILLWRRITPAIRRSRRR